MMNLGLGEFVVIVLGLVPHYIGMSLPADRHFWHRRGKTGFYECSVGVRKAVVFSEYVNRWKAVVTLDLRERIHQNIGQGNFKDRSDAMCWALDTMANMAAEYDTYPLLTKE